METKKLYRTRDGVVAGVCGGVAEYFGFKASMFRFITLILILAGGLSLWVYIIMWLIMPKAPQK